MLNDALKLVEVDAIVGAIVDQHREYVGVPQSFYGDVAVRRMVLSALVQGAEAALKSINVDEIEERSFASGFADALTARSSHAE